LTPVVGHQSHVLLVAAGPHVHEELGRLQKHAFVHDAIVKSKGGGLIARWKSGLSFGKKRHPKVRIVPLEVADIAGGAPRIRDKLLSVGSSERIGGICVLMLPAQSIR
jgi:hypothetical protein